MNILVVFPQICLIEVFDIANDITNQFPQSVGTSLNGSSTVSQGFQENVFKICK